LKNLWDIVHRIQQGDSKAAWEFTEHIKIKLIIKKRIAEYRRMYYWLPQEDLDDVEFGLRPILLELAKKFKLPKQRNEGRIVSYFSLRILGEADFLLKKITGMRQMVSDDGKVFLKGVIYNVEEFEDIDSKQEGVSVEVLDKIESQRLWAVILSYLKSLPESSNDILWLNFYLLKLQKMTWDKIAAQIGYTYSDFSWLKENTYRFINRFKNFLLSMGEQINCKICGIFTDSQNVGFCVIDAFSHGVKLIWSREYSTYDDLDKIESKLGDIFRQFEITFVVMNETYDIDRAQVILMRYLNKRESFVEFLDIDYFNSFREQFSNKLKKLKFSDPEKNAFLLSQVKRSQVELIYEEAVQRKNGRSKLSDES